MVRHKNDNLNRFRKTKCRLCGEETSDRKSEAVQPDEAFGSIVLAKDKNGGAITLKALPRQHRDGVGCRSPEAKAARAKAEAES